MAKSGRRVQANARTLSYAVRQYFRPVLREIQPAAASTSYAGSSSSMILAETVQPRDASPVSSPTPRDQLIPTQPDEEDEEQPAVVSEKSLGKRKRVEDDDPLSQAPAGIQTRFTQANIPPELKKYWHQRYRLFSRYDEGIQMDYDGWFSVTPENVAAQIAERCRCKTVVDAFCGVGGNAIQFAMTCEKVIAIDNSPIRIACAKANAKIYGVEDYITFVQGDYLEWAKQQSELPISQREDIDVIFMSPPWGGISYQEDSGQQSALSQLQDPDKTFSLPDVGDSANSTETSSPYACYPLSKLLPRHGKELFDISRKLTRNIAYFLPRNLDIKEAASLVDPSEKVEVEEEWMGSKLKALTLYYGDLAKQT